MNNFSKKEWIDLVFENRNKSYGAYELRAKSGNMTLKALFIGVMLVISLVSIPVIANHLTPSPVALNNDLDKEPFITGSTIIDVEWDKIEKPKTSEKENKAEEKPKVKNTEKPVEDVIKYDTPKITENQTTDNEMKSKDEIEGKKTGAEDIEGDINGKIDTTSPGKENKEGVEDGILTNDEGKGDVLEDYKVDRKAEFPGGVQNFIKAIQKSYRLPDLDRKSEYTVFVSFVVEIDGSLSDINIVRDPGYGLGKEAIRTLKSIKTKWEPALKDGKPVRTRFHLPIKVNIR